METYLIEWMDADGTNDPMEVKADDAAAALGVVLDERELDDHELVFTVRPAQRGEDSDYGLAELPAGVVQAFLAGTDV